MATQKDNELSPARVGSVCCAVALSLMLAGQWPADAVAYAAEGGGASAAGAASEGAQGDVSAEDGHAVDVSADWTREGIVISHAGSYVLAADVKDAGTLSLAVPKGEAVELDLAGHTVAFADSVTCGIDLSSCEGTVRIVNSKPSYKDAQKEKTADNLAPCFTVHAVDPADDVYGVYFSTKVRAAGASSPEASFSDVSIEVTAEVSSKESLARDVSGAYIATNDAQTPDDVDFSLVRSSIAVSVKAKDSQAEKALSIGEEAQPETGVACAFFTACKGVAIDGTVNLSAAGLDDAVGIASSVDDAFSFGCDYETSAALSANVKGNADGSILGHVAEGFDLKRAEKLAFSASSVAAGRDEAPAAATTLCFDGAKSVVARAASQNDATAADGSAAAGEPSGAVGATEGSAAADVALLGDPVIAEAERQSADALGEGVFGRRSLASLVELQDIRSTRTPASLVRDGKVKGTYVTVAEALSHMASGDTLRLDADVENLEFAQAGNSLVSYSIDLAGHTVSSLTVSSQAQVKVVSSAQGGTIGAAGNGGAALTYSGGGKLSVEGVSVESYSGSTKACGISVTGSGNLNLSDVDIAVSAQGIEARGINQTSKGGGAIVVKGGSIDVSTSAAGVAVYGITSVAQAKTLSMEDCPIAVRGGTSTACAIDSKGIVSVKGISFQVKIAVSATEASASLWGVRAASAASSVWLTNCAVEVSAQNVPKNVQSWCVTTGDESTKNSVAITLDGACSFASCTNTDISLYKTPLQLGEAFSAQGQISLSTRGLVNDVFAARTKATDSAKDFALSFSPVAGTEYEGWTADVSSASAGKLAWQHAAVAKIESTGAEYGSVAQAIAQAKSGDTIKLVANATVRGAVSASQQNLAIDLGSHTLTIAAAGDANAGANLAKGAFAYSGKGTLTVKGGQVAIEVGRDVETATTAASPYQGFAVSGGGSLVLSGCSATVTYTGSTTTDPQVTLYGASNVSGSFRLQDSSRLTVRAAQTKGGFGACAVAGAYGAGSKQTDVISVDSSSSVAVENNAKALVQGQIAYPDEVLTGTGSSTNADLIEISLDPKSDMCNEIQQLFKRFAKFDSNLDENGKEYNTGIYYASPMELSNGFLIWAYSDPVSADDAGKLESIKATHFFVRTDYQAALDAYGVTSAKGYAGAMDVSGSVSATTTQGHAFGAYVPEKASWSVPEGKMSATATGGEYRGRIGKFDLSNYVSFASKPQQAVVFPSGASYREVARVKPQAAKTMHADALAEERIEGGVTYNDLFGNANSAVRVSFSNIRTAQGAVTSQAVSATRGKTLSASGARVPAPSDYTVGDVTYRFIGWRLSSAGSSTFAYDSAALASNVAIDANLAGVSDGAVEFVACYIPVDKGEHLVKFRVEYGVFAMAAPDGATPTYAECAGLAADTVPSRLTTVSSSQYTTTFKGWAADSSGAYEYRQGETVYASSVPAVRGDVTYSARFESTLVTASLGLFYMRKMSDGTYSYTRDLVKDADWTRDAIGLANERAKVGETLVQNGVTYTLLGWSPRVSDKEPLYTDTLPLANDGDILSDRPAFYAIYKQAEKTYNVSFYVDGKLYSEAKNVTASTTLYNAWNASSNKTEPTSQKAGETFKGWNADEKANTYYRASIKKVGEIDASGNEDSINLYAIWSTATDNKTPDGGKDNANGNNGGGNAGANDGGNAADGGSGAGTGGGSGTGGASFPASNATLASSGSGGAALASALKPAEDADADGDDADSAAGDAALASVANASTGGMADGDGIDFDDEASDGQDESSSNAAGVVGVIVAALAAIGATAWWFLRRRAGIAEDDEDDLPAPDADTATPEKAAEGIRF